MYTCGWICLCLKACAQRSWWPEPSCNQKRHIFGRHMIKRDTHVPIKRDVFLDESRVCVWNTTYKSPAIRCRNFTYIHKLCNFTYKHKLCNFTSKHKLCTYLSSLEVQKRHIFGLFFLLDFLLFDLFFPAAKNVYMCEYLYVCIFTCMIPLNMLENAFVW
jgi:hypothetical protein